MMTRKFLVMIKMMMFLCATCSKKHIKMPIFEDAYGPKTVGR